MLFYDQVLVFLQGVDVGYYWCVGKFGVGIGVLGFDERNGGEFDVDGVNYSSGGRKKMLMFGVDWIVYFIVGYLVF